VQLEEVFTILKNACHEDFYKLRGSDSQFIFKENIAISFTKTNEDNDRYGYGYFFDKSGKPISSNDEYDQLIKTLCELKDFPETYDNIKFETFTIKYNDTDIYQFECFTISNYSSLHVSLPTSIKAFDFEYNMCKILNHYDGGSTFEIVNSILQKNLQTINSTFDDFLNH